MTETARLMMTTTTTASHPRKESGLDVLAPETETETETDRASCGAFWSPEARYRSLHVDV